MARASNEEIARLEALHAENPRGRVFTHLAEAYRRAGETARARELLRRGLADHPDYASAHVVMGRVLEDVGEGAAAQQSFARVLELDPHNMIALRRLAAASEDAGRAEEALAHWSALAALEPGDPDIEARIDALRAGDGPSSAVAEDPPVPSEAPPAAPGDDPFEEERRGEPVPAEADVVGAVWKEPSDLEIDLEESWAGPAEEAGEDAVERQDAFDDLPLIDLAATPFEFTPLPPAGATLAGADDADPAGVATDSAGAIEGPVEGAWPELEAAEPAEGVWPELEAAEPAEGVWPELEAAEPDEGPPDFAGVETETLADLYAAQGLHARAADVYRRLLRRDPGDARLQAKLYEAESRVAGGEAEPVRPEWGDVAGAAAVPAEGGSGDAPGAERPAVEAPLPEPVERDGGAEEELAAPPHLAPPAPEPITFADPFAYGADDGTDVGAAWFEPGAVGEDEDSVEAPAAESAAAAAPEPGALWTGEEFDGGFAPSARGAEADAERPPAEAQTWADGAARAEPPVPDFGVGFGGDREARSPLRGPGVQEEAEAPADPADTHPAAPGASVDAARSEGAEAGRVDGPDGGERPAPAAADGLAAELADALSGGDDAGTSIRDALREVISWTAPAAGPAAAVEPWSPLEARGAPALPDAAPSPTPSDDPADEMVRSDAAAHGDAGFSGEEEAPAAAGEDAQGPGLSEPPGAEQAPAGGEETSQAVGEAEPPVAVPARPEPFDPASEPWAATPSTSAAGRPDGGPMLELGEADRIRPSDGPAAPEGPREPAVNRSGSPPTEAGPTTPQRDPQQSGELGDLARSLLDASVGGGAGPGDGEAEEAEDEELEVFRSWLRSLKK